ncbi:P-loop containing nucleoside triphosphate hydrolase protein [Phlyctochytrium arcticum]|nr:P-loop containing nucleoside triphosphate hydrolase protein [Phlyctochytrium arcticum]
MSGSGNMLADLTAPTKKIHLRMPQKRSAPDSQASRDETSWKKPRKVEPSNGSLKLPSSEAAESSPAPSLSPTRTPVDETDDNAHIREHYTDPSRFAKLKVEDDRDTIEARENMKKDTVSHLFSQDYTFLAQKADHRGRPIWVCDDGRIILEAFSSLAAQAQDFLITIAEPVSRPARIHEFKLTAYSLYAAVSVGMETHTILEVLERFSKVKLPERVKNFIKECTMAYGKVKLVLKDNRYFIESTYPEVLKKLMLNPDIAKARVTREDDFVSSLASNAKPLLPATNGNGRPTNGNDSAESSAFGAVITLDDMDEDDAEDESEFVHSFEVDKAQVEEVKKHCIGMDYPLMEEYDFRHDALTPNLDIDLSPKTTIRDYQEKSLSKMFGGGGGRARSGIIVLPTGAGKTLVGITAACTVKKSTLVLCTNALSVEQWAREFRNWSTVKEGQIAKFTADDKKKFVGDAGIVVSTYTMISHSGKRSWDTARMIEWINSVEWGLLILDEVHVVPANVFRRVLTTVSAHTKLGLTATLVREDDKIEDLNFLIGPKLYEANWMDLAQRGHIAKVEATEIWCGMTSDFYQEYLESKPGKRRLLSVMNPSKFQACEYLIKAREAAGDKIIVFSDNVFALDYYAKKMRKPFIYGGTAHSERQVVLNRFRSDGPQSYQTVFLSKVGDTSLDLPEATCLIQISSQFGSRRQEAQRMGRILRAKRRNEEGFRSRFFTLVSRDTDEVQFSAKRKRFLIDQGYEFKVIANLEQLIPPDARASLSLNLRSEQVELLEQIRMTNVDASGDTMADLTASGDAPKMRWGGAKQKKIEEAARRVERHKKEEAKAKEKTKHSLFRSWRAGK